MSSSIHTASTPKASAEIREPSAATASMPSSVDRQSFDRAIERAAERRTRSKSDERDKDDEPSPEASAAANALHAPKPAQDDAALPGVSPLTAPLFASSQPVDAAGANPAFGMEQFGAALSRLQVPAGPNGPQQWQFSLVERGGPVMGVQLNAAAAGPWQMTVHSAARDRQVLHANLDKLRARLRERGANVGEVHVESANEDDHR